MATTGKNTRRRAFSTAAHTAPTADAAAAAAVEPVEPIAPVEETAVEPEPQAPAVQPEPAPAPVAPAPAAAPAPAVQPQPVAPPQPQQTAHVPAGPVPTGEVALHQQAPPPSFPGVSLPPFQQQQQAAPPLQPVSGAIFAPPPVAGFQARQKTAMIGLRVPEEVKDWWTSQVQILQGLYRLPDGVLPRIAAEIIAENMHEILARAVKQVHNQDIGPESNGNR